MRSSDRKILVQSFDLGFGHIRVLNIEDTADTAAAAGVKFDKLEPGELLIF